MYFSCDTCILQYVTTAQRIFILTAATIGYLISHEPATADETPSIETVVVEGRNRSLPYTSASNDIVTIDRKDIVRSGAASLAAVLETIPDISFIERGAPGAQSDISIRGNSPESALVMINGVPAGDPQTGHFIMDMPIDLAAIDRIEVIRGGAGPLYGSSGGGGAINIITGPADGFAGGVSVGSYGSLDTSARFGRRDPSSSFGMSFRGGQSDGYKSDSDLRYGGFSVDGSFSRNRYISDWNIGYLDKHFGAGGFYGDYPSYEKTRTLTGSFNNRIVLSDNDMIRIRAGSRGHGDDFILVRDKPEVYRNKHYNRLASVSIEYLARRCGFLDVTLGAAGDRYGITSPLLGNRTDRNIGAYGGLDAHLQHADLTLCLRYDDDSRRGGMLSPGIGVSVPVGSSLRFKLSHAGSFRRPTYTDLYYVSPANVGDPDLKSEKTNAFDAGVVFANRSFFAGAFVFRSKAVHVIDWVRNTESDPWQAVNHGSILITGLTADFGCLLPGDRRCAIRLMALDRDVKRRAGLTSKYVLNRPVTTVTASVNGPLAGGVRASMSVRYERTEDGDSHAPVSIAATKRIGGASLSLSLSNAFNERYDEFPGYSAPGRWARCTIEWVVKP